MNEFDINRETIKQEIIKGNGLILDKSYSKEFDVYISTNYPWVPVTGYRIDWNKVEGSYKRFKWSEANEEETLFFLNNSCLKECKEVVIIYGHDEPCLLIELNDYTRKNLWRFLPPGFGTRFLVGIKRCPQNKIVLIKNCFIEIDMDCTDWLTASY